MIVKNIIDEDFTNYKTCCMFIGFPYCTFKCEKECNCSGMCQNSALAHSPDISVSTVDLVARYLNNPLSSAVVFGGLEPFDSFEDIVRFLREFRKHTQDTVIIYTGYYADEIGDSISYLRDNFVNIIIKFGRFIPNKSSHYDEVLGVYLASDNQYAERIC